VLETPKIRRSNALSVRLPDDLADRIGREAQRLRVSQSDVVRMTLSQRFERDDKRVA
jgi:predicted transcriptional regulator